MKFKFNNLFIEFIKQYVNDTFTICENLNELHLLLNTEYINKIDKQYFSKLSILGNNDRQSIFIKKFHNFIDNDKNNKFNIIYYDFINKYIKNLFPNEDKLVIQKTPNLRISFPNLTAIGSQKNDPKNIIGLHKDSDFGHHLEEINFIIPITDMYDTNSIYYEPFINSKKDYEEFDNLKLNTDEFFMGLFNNLLHYNKINDTGKTRISFDFRVIPYSKYILNIDFFKDTKFELNDYYIVI
jgi:hypothetical protein